MNYLVDTEKVPWNKHPMVDGAYTKVLHTKENHGALATVMMVRLPKGTSIPEHVHEESDDILYVLEGRAKMEIAGVGSLDMKKGSCIRVPKNTKHRIYDITEDILQYNVFSPATT